jgi:hypothetical protein
MTDEPISLDQAKAIVATKTAPKVTEESIKAKIADVKYIISGQVTICLLTMANGFVIDGLSAPASPENFNADVGQRFAYNNAFLKLWPLEGYLLREQLASAPVAGGPPVTESQSSEPTL